MIGPCVVEQAAEVEHALPVRLVSADPGAQPKHVEVKPMRFGQAIEFTRGFRRQPEVELALRGFQVAFEVVHEGHARGELHP